MFEKVNPAHPDKCADRIAGAIVDYAYSKEENPKVAVEVLTGHHKCLIINETSVSVPQDKIESIVKRILKTEDVSIEYIEVPQDEHLSKNQERIRCGDNGIFKGTPTTQEQKELTAIAHEIYSKYECDGKYILSSGNLTICQSNCKGQELHDKYESNYKVSANPIGDWTGGFNVDSGATNRKLGSDMGDGVTGGGLHGKDLSKADVSINIYCYLLAQKSNAPVLMSCAIGDEYINGIPYEEIVRIARDYIKSVGGFEKFAEWGLIR